ncbi:ADP-glyceromanno-heptose 6-epimerase [Stella sp.]|uniref:ADP-glyceromanno-heptose 6-epimerase n=1 Tax=Stella sp. TaxID=2912054 RepID=UPI0035B01998
MILVTGGAGFIGSNLVAALEARGGPEIAVVDRLGSDEKWRNLAKRELAAIVPPEDLDAWLARHGDTVEMVFHLGAVSATTERDADLVIASNFTLSLRLWDWCAATGARFVYASSGATYGSGAEGFDDDGSREALARLRPLNAYGWSKHLFDRRVARLVAEGRPAPPQWVGLKFFNVYGPNEGHKGRMASVVTHVLPQVLAGGPAVLFRSHRPDYADGGQLRDFVHVDDCVGVMLWLRDRPDVSGLFNVGTGRARSFADLAAAVFRAAGREPDIAYVDTPAEIRDRYQYFTEARIERLRDAGYPGQFLPLEEGVRRYVQDFLLTDDPYR